MPIEMKFVVDDTRHADFKAIPRGATIVHPGSIVERELSAKEIKKLRKSKN